MLLVPWAVGCGVARRFGTKEFLLLVSTLMFFLAQNQFMNWLRLRFATNPDPKALTRVRLFIFLFTVIGGLVVLPLIFSYHLTALVYFGVIGAVFMGMSMFLVVQKKDRTLAGQILASAGLSLSAPPAYYVARGVMEHQAFELWLLNSLFFLGGVFYVQLKIDALAVRDQLKTLTSKIRFASKPLLIDLAILTLALFSLRMGSLSSWAILAFVPTALQAIIGTLRLDHPAKFKRVGIISTLHSISFAAIVIWLA